MVSGNDAMFAELLADKAADLHPDLVPYLRESETFGTILKHPLVNDMFVINGIANRMYEQKRAAMEEALAEEDWHTVVFLVERPWRCEYLIEMVLGRDEDGTPFPVKMFNDPDLRALVADVWVDSENIAEHVDDWLAITEGHVPGEPLLFGDQEAFDALPVDDRGLIEVWRGDCYDGGWSWSTRREVAEFFCRRWQENNDLLHGFVEPRFVFGYLPNRNEDEVMVRREHVQHLTRTPIEEVEQ
jgi:hypothetical protein